MRQETSKLTTFVVSASADVTLFVATIVCAVLALLTGWLPPRGNWTYRFARLWSRWMMLGAWSKVGSEFEEPLDPQQGYVFLANHQSLYDIPALIRGIPGQARFLAKKSLFRIPIFGWALAMGGFVPVDRSDRKASQETFRIAVERLQAGNSLVIFPEETRSRDGELLPFKRGGVLLALKTGYPIVPVGIDGTLEMRHRDSMLAVRPGRVRVRYGKPIDVSGWEVSRSQDLQERVRAEIERLKSSLDS
ncbi:MAG: 1-acyl-sn-glycerol-3-phosphate acyltransferase [Thermoanaerobaculia bacterium]|nr:1-acyl-sn-glycerol-3-phosphate acyltransferase [Thermoanaerobaculia bacterium]